MENKEILESTVEWLETLHEAGIFDNDDLEAIIENEDLTIEDLAGFVQEMEAAAEEYKTEELLEGLKLDDELIEDLTSLVEDGEITEEDAVNLIETLKERE